MKRLVTAMLAGLVVLAIAAPVFAWEFSMTGEYEYRFRYVGRTGEHDLFGLATMQNQGTPNTSGFIGFAGPNVWDTGATYTRPGDTATGAGSGVLITRGGYSRYESDAFWDDQRLTIRPEIRVNPAIRVHGVYTVGGLRNKFYQRADVYGDGAGTPTLERYYMMNESPGGAYNTAAIGSWEQVRATVQTPLAIFSIGVKDFPFGTGASLAYHTCANAFLTIVPYGPFRFLHGWWLATPASRLVGHQSTPDPYTKPSFFQGALVTYNAANVEIGGGAIIRNVHAGPNGPALPFGEVPAVAAPPYASAAWVPGSGSDNYFGQYLAYMKYFNGRFFFNAEYEWLTSDTHRIWNSNLGTGYLGQVGAAPTFTESYLGFVELGTVSGPCKVSLAYFRATCDVLNTGRNDAGILVKQFTKQNMNYQVAEPYNFLMFNTYGGGNQSFDADGTGEMSDAFAYAGRMDYAIASNLNFWASYMWAHRLERNGVLKGQYSASGAPIFGGVGSAIVPGTSPGTHAYFVASNFGGATGLLGGPINPYVDDGFIGWEAQVGADWKILENLTWNTRYAYWQPGDWFTQAYQAFVPTVPGLTGNGMLQGRDPIHAVQGSLLINF